MKMLIAIVLLGLLGTSALNSPPLREGPGEGAEQLEKVTKAVNTLKGNTLPQPLPQGRGGQNEPATTFLTLDITIDPQDQPLGAYQFELISEDASFTVVGVEAGEHAAFDHGRPPYFDPVAKQGKTDRLILAEYAKPELKANQLPHEATRVATVHVMLTSPINEDEQPTIQLTLTAAGNADGERIDAQISHSFRTPERPE